MTSRKRASFCNIVGFSQMQVRRFRDSLEETYDALSTHDVFSTSHKITWPDRSMINCALEHCSCADLKTPCKIEQSC